MTAFEIIKKMVQEFHNRNDWKIKGNSISFKNINNGWSTFVFDKSGKVVEYID